jgi:hypothetical protein
MAARARGPHLLQALPRGTRQSPLASVLCPALAATGSCSRPRPPASPAPSEHERAACAPAERRKKRRRYLALSVEYLLRARGVLCVRQMPHRRESVSLSVWACLCVFCGQAMGYPAASSHLSGPATRVRSCARAYGLMRMRCVRGRVRDKAHLVDCVADHALPLRHGALPKVDLRSGGRAGRACGRPCESGDGGSAAGRTAVFRGFLTCSVCVSGPEASRPTPESAPPAPLGKAESQRRARARAAHHAVVAVHRVKLRAVRQALVSHPYCLRA